MLFWFADLSVLFDREEEKYDILLAEKERRGAFVYRAFSLTEIVPQHNITRKLMCRSTRRLEVMRCR